MASNTIFGLSPQLHELTSLFSYRALGFNARFVFSSTHNGSFCLFPVLRAFSILQFTQDFIIELRLWCLLLIWSVYSVLMITLMFFTSQSSLYVLACHQIAIFVIMFPAQTLSKPPSKHFLHRYIQLSNHLVVLKVIIHQLHSSVSLVKLEDEMDKDLFQDIEIHKNVWYRYLCLNSGLKKIVNGTK